MEEYSATEDLSEKLWSYFQRRNYIDDFLSKQELNVSSDEMALVAAIEKDASNRNAVTYSTVIHDVAQAELQFGMLKSWISDINDEKCQTELSPLLTPLLCHIFLDALRDNHRHILQKFLKRYFLTPVFNDEWIPVFDQLMALNSYKDIESQPLLHVLRTSKYHLKVSPKSISLLRKFLSSRSLHILIQVLHAWFELETITEDMANFEEDIYPSFLPADGEQEDESEDDFDDEEYIDVNDTQMEQLISEIHKMRSQPTPPPPLLLYTAHKTEGVVCGRVSSDGKLAATGAHNSEVRVWGLCETRLSPQLHPDYFTSAKVATYTESLNDSQQQ